MSLLVWSANLCLLFNQSQTSFIAAHASVVMVANKFSNILVVEQCGLIFIVCGKVSSQVVGKILQSCTHWSDVSVQIELNFAKKKKKIYIYIYYNNLSIYFAASWSFLLDDRGSEVDRKCYMLSGAK